MKQRLFAAVVAALLLALAGCTPEESDPVSPSSSSATEPSAFQVEPALEEVSEPLEEIPSVPEVTSSMPEPPSTAEPGSEEDTGKLPPDNDPVPEGDPTTTSDTVNDGSDTLYQIWSQVVDTIEKTVPASHYAYIETYPNEIEGWLCIGVLDEGAVRDVVESCPNHELLTVKYRPATVSLAEKRALVEAVEAIDRPENSDLYISYENTPEVSITLSFEDKEEQERVEAEIYALAVEMDFPGDHLTVELGTWYGGHGKAFPD